MVFLFCGVDSECNESKGFLLLSSFFLLADVHRIATYSKEQELKNTDANSGRPAVHYLGRGIVHMRRMS